MGHDYKFVLDRELSEETRKDLEKLVRSQYIVIVKFPKPDVMILLNDQIGGHPYEVGAWVEVEFGGVGCTSCPLFYVVSAEKLGESND